MIHQRDYETLFGYFVGARGEHAVHIRALIHAGFEVRPDGDRPERRSLVYSPTEPDLPLGMVEGEPTAEIRSFLPPPAPPVPTPTVERVIRIKEGSGF